MAGKRQSNQLAHTAQFSYTPIFGANYIQIYCTITLRNTPLSHWQPLFVTWFPFHHFLESLGYYKASGLIILNAYTNLKKKSAICETFIYSSQWLQIMYLFYTTTDRVDAIARLFPMQSLTPLYSGVGGVSCFFHFWLTANFGDQRAFVWLNVQTMQ